VPVAGGLSRISGELQRITPFQCGEPGCAKRL
jgi:hypothetical protein